jgi:DNA adenine methylase
MGTDTRDNLPLIRLDDLAFGCDEDSLEFMQPPYSVYGGKRFLGPRIAAALPPHNRYVEPMAGAAAVFFAKHPAREEILSDVDAEKVFALRFLKLHTERDRQHLAAYRWTPNKRLFHKLKEAKGITRPVDRFYQFLYLRWNSFGSHGESFAMAAGGTRKWRPYIEKKMPAFQQRMRSTRVHRMDYAEAIRRFDSPDALFYFDPPYVKTMNRGSNFGAVDPAKMAEAMKPMKGKWILSNADSPDVVKANEGHCVRYVDVATQVNQVSKSKPGGQGPHNRRELVIANFELPPSLGRKTSEPEISPAKKPPQQASIAAAERTPSTIAMAEGPTIVEYMQASLHEAFTHKADQLAKLGFVSTDTRIELSGAVGDALKIFRDCCEKLPELRQRISRTKLREFFMMDEDGSTGTPGGFASAMRMFVKAEEHVAKSTEKILNEALARNSDGARKHVSTEFETRFSEKVQGAKDQAELVKSVGNAVGSAVANAMSKLKIENVVNIPERRTTVEVKAPITIGKDSIVIRQGEVINQIKMPEYLKVEKMEVTAKLEPRMARLEVTERDSKGKLKEAEIRTTS